jgi:two-component system nitrate/nitrite response regulator NarL
MNRVSIEPTLNQNDGLPSVPINLDQKEAHKVVVADGHELVRDGIAAKIQESCNVEVIAKTSDGYETIKAFRNHMPDLLIMDLALTRPAGTEILTKIFKMKPDVKIIVVTSDPSISNAFSALSRGAIAFMPKQVSASDFVNAVNAVINGFSYLPRDVLSQFVKSRRNLSRMGNIFGLSPRELEIMKACADGLSAKQVAYDLDISVRTVETHRHNIYKKTECKSQSELSKIAECI